MGRKDWVDAAKGVAIMLVVLGHALRGIDASEVELPNLDWLDQGIYAFHMPLFFALAGWFFIAGIRNRTFREFLTGKARRILYPLILWTYLFLGAKLLAGQFVNSPVVLSDVLIIPIPGILHFWFLWDLLLLSLVFFPLRHLLVEGQLRVALWASVFAVVFLLGRVELSAEMDRWFGSAIWYAPFFLLGVGAGQVNWSGALRPWLGMVAVAVFATVQVFADQIEAAGWARSHSMVLVVTSLTAIACLHELAPRVLGKALAQLGAASMVIYLGHTFFSAAFREAMIAFGVQSPALHLAIGLGVGLVGPLILLAVARSLGVSRILGFETQAVPATVWALVPRLRPRTAILK